MRSLFAKALLGVASLTALLSAVTAVRQHRTFPAPFPAIQASTDPGVIERGRYLALGAAHCGDCHGTTDATALEPSPLSGGHEFHLPLGVVRVPNITPDDETGIGRYSDAEIARMLRYGVRPDGTSLLPFMPFSDLADDDLTALISFLRAQSPVEHAVEPHEPTLLGRVARAYLIEPMGPASPPPERVPHEPTAEYGRYLANNVANCVGCHTERNLRTGAFTGPRFGGGGVLESHDAPPQSFVSPNLTPHPRQGWIASWSEDVFVRRLQAGKVYPQSPMPWSSFQNMREDDLRAIYRYLQTLPPADGGPDPRRPESVRLEPAGGPPVARL
jgi:mono/diheme cytochrome c family protein